MIRKRLNKQLKRISIILIILITTILVLSGCNRDEMTAKNVTVENKDLYNLIADYIPEIKDMQCTLDEEYIYKNDEYPYFYIKYLEKSIQNMQRNKVYGGTFSYILDSIAKYNPESVYNIDSNEIDYSPNGYDSIASPPDHIWEGEYYVLEFTKVAINGPNKQTIKYTIFIKKDYENDTKPRINLWKHTETEGFGTPDACMPNYDICNLEYSAIYLKK